MHHIICCSRQSLEKVALSALDLKGIVAIQCWCCSDSRTDDQVERQAVPRVALCSYVAVEVTVTVLFGATYHTVAVVVDAAGPLSMKIY